MFNCSWFGFFHVLLIGLNCALGLWISFDLQSDASTWHLVTIKSRWRNEMIKTDSWTLSRSLQSLWATVCIGLLCAETASACVVTMQSTPSSPRDNMAGERDSSVKPHSVSVTVLESHANSMDFLSLYIRIGGSTVTSYESYFLSEWLVSGALVNRSHNNHNNEIGPSQQHLQNSQNHF